MLVEILLSIFTVLVLVIISFKFLRKRYEPDRKYAVLITGCDSGLGYSIAKHCHEIGFTVFATCLENDSDGANQLKQLSNVFVIPLNVTESSSVRNAYSSVENILKENAGMSLKILINNAGVMIFGEFSWQTETQIYNQINVNLIGAMNVTKVFLPLIRRNEGRIINICSHCSLEALPGLSVYAASKAALLAWTNALRIEMKKFNVAVILFIPGSYVLDTKILSNHRQHIEEMQKNMSSEDWNLYEDYFKDYNYYLSLIPAPQGCRKIEHNHFYKLLNDSLLCIYPRAYYCYSPWRYFLYHSLFKISPTGIRDWLVVKFVNTPTWKPLRKNNE